MIVSVYPELEGMGGVQRFGRSLRAAIDAWAASHSLPHKAIVLTGPPSGGSSMHLGGSRLRLVAELLRTPATLCYFAHPFLAPAIFPAGMIRPRIPYAVHAHGIDVWTPMSPLRRHALRGAAIVTASSAYTAERTLILQQVEPDRIKVLHPAVSLPPAATGSAAGPRFFLCVGRLSEADRDKGYGLLIDAFAVLHERLGAATPELWIVGDGNDRGRLEEHAGRLAVASLIRFTGRVSDAELARLYSDALAFVLPSLKEGFGIVYAEAMSFGRPCIGLRAGGVTDVIEDGANGLLVEHPDRNELAAAMMRLATDEALCNRLGHCARERVESHFSQPSFDGRVAVVLDELAR